jgi:hypothetical protein
LTVTDIVPVGPVKLVGAPNDCGGAGMLLLPAVDGTLPLPPPLHAASAAASVAIVPKAM